MNKLILSFVFNLTLFSVIAQNFWQESEKASMNSDAQIAASEALYYKLNLAAFSNSIFSAPLKSNNQQLSNVQIDIPMPDGSMEKFMVFESPVMELGLASKFPEFKTFIFQSMKNQLNYGRADITHKGFHLMLFSIDGTVFIDPISQTNNTDYIVYYKKNFTTDKALPVCLSEEDENEINVDQSFDNLNEITVNKSAKSSNGNELRTYRIAISATAEYTIFHGGTVADGLAALVTTVNRVNGVYEREFTARLVLVANNDLLIYTDASTDPFGNPSNSFQLLGENQNSIDNVIGFSNYDIGHVVGRSGSGLASFAVVCRTSKAQGTTGISNPIGDPFDIDYVAHEIGHQFAGSHTYNGSSGSCGGNISTSSAYEPGSGTTIMAYAGICAPQNIQNNSDDYFHGRSFTQVLNYTTNSQGNNCPIKTNTGNTIPQITIVSSTGLTIPKSTPFELEALITDADGDAVTYCWEQYDLGPSNAPNSPSGNAPLFRSFQPTTNPVRTFPQISDIVNNTQTLGEILPDYTRAMKFRITARDNVAGGGAVNNDVLDVAVTASAGPFLVTNPNTAITWTAGDPYEINWDVANTTSSPVNCNTVDIFLSTDGGYTYDIVLATDVPNTGTTNINAPFALTNDARVKVKAANNVFFDISDTDFQIESNCNSIDPSITLDAPLEGATWCINTTGQLSFSANSPDLVITSYQWFRNGNIINGATSNTLTINNTQLSDNGDYFCTMSNGCNTVSTNTAVVNVISSPIVPTITQVGGQLQSSFAGLNQWYLNGVLLAGETSQFLDINQAGAYSVESVTGVCSANSAAFVTAVKDLNELAVINIKPNPSQGIFNIQIGKWKEDVQLQVFNVLGQDMLGTRNFKNNTNLDLSSFTNGTYIVKLSSEGYTGSFKLVKE